MKEEISFNNPNPIPFPFFLVTKIAIIIPARFSSSRFPGKPLVDILGKPMVIRVADIAQQVIDQKHIYIATDDKRIYNTAIKYGYNSIMTSQFLFTGTDRVAEASLDLDYDIIINIQGDEPLINPNDIRSSIVLKQNNPESVINCYTKITGTENAASPNIPKVVVAKNSNLLYASRALIPSSKGPLATKPIYFKQVCIYAFSKNELALYTAANQKQPLESIEDIEILRFLELGVPVLMHYCKKSSLAVDVPSDLSSVINLLSHSDLK